MNIIQRKKIAYRYSSALAALTLDESVISELHFIQALVSEPKIQVFLADPALEASEKKSKIVASIEAYVSEAIKNLVLLLIEKNRVSVLPFLCETYKKIYYDAKGIVIADVSAPTPLDSAELAFLKKELERLTAKTVQFGEISHDEALLAGLKVTIGDRQIDFSMKSTLSAIKKDLLSSL